MSSTKRPVSTIDANNAKVSKVVTEETILRDFPESPDGLKHTVGRLKPVHGGYYRQKNGEVVVYYEQHRKYYNKFDVEELNMLSLGSPTSQFPMTDMNVVLTRMRDVKDPTLLKSTTGSVTRTNGHLYKREGDVVVYFEPHNKFYTMHDIQSYNVLAVNFKIQKMKDNKKADRIIVLNDDDGYVQYKPEGLVHPDLVYRVKGDAQNHFKFEAGDGGNVKLAPCFKEYEDAIKEGRKNSPGIALKLDESDHAPMWNCRYKKYYLLSVSRADIIRAGTRNNHAKLKTIEGKAASLASNAVSSQNERSQKHPDVVLTLDHKKHIPFLTKVFSMLLAVAAVSQDVAELIELGIPIEPYHWSNDKLDDDAKAYIKKTSSGMCDFSNISLSLKILNPRKKPEDGVLKNIVNGNYFEISPIMKAALRQVDENIGKRGGAVAYSKDDIGELAKQIAFALTTLANNAKNNQNAKIERGREFKELTNEDVLMIKHNIINLFFKLEGMCSICGHPIGFLKEDPEGRLLLSLERIDNNEGYEKDDNITLVYNMFNIEQRNPTSQDDDETPFGNMKWTPDLFMQTRRILLKDDFRITLSDLSEEERRSLSRFEF